MALAILAHIEVESLRPNDDTLGGRRLCVMHTVNNHVGQGGVACHVEVAADGGVLFNRNVAIAL